MHKKLLSVRIHSVDDVLNSLRRPWCYIKILELVMILEAIDSIFQKLLEIDIVNSQPMPCLNYIRTCKCTGTWGRDERLLLLK